MSIAAVRVSQDEITVGADSMLSTTYDMVSSNVKKIHIKHDDAGNVSLIYVPTGANYLITAFNRLVKGRIYDSGYSSMEYYIKALTDVVDEFNDQYIKSSENEGIDVIVVCKLYFCCHVINTNSIRQIKMGEYAAIGCGDDVALGALYVGGTVQQAVAAACIHKLHCGGAINTESIYRDVKPEPLKELSAGTREAAQKY